MYLSIKSSTHLHVPLTPEKCTKGTNTLQVYVKINLKVIRYVLHRHKYWLRWRVNLPYRSIIMFTCRVSQASLQRDLARSNPD